MAVAVDNTLVGAASGNGVVVLNLSGFSTGGASRLVTVIVDSSNDAGTVTSVTATGLTFSFITSKNKASGQGNIEMWGAWAASTQTSVSITVNFAAGSFPQCTARTFVLSGTDATGTVAAAIGALNSFGSASSGVPSASVVTTRANSLVVAAVGSDSNNAITAGSGQTIDGTTQVVGGVSEIAAMRQNSVTATSGTTVTMNATLTAAAVGLLAVEILAPVPTIPPSFRVNKLRPHAFSPGLAR